jgi:PAS domain S-box-containing protein
MRQYSTLQKIIESTREPIFSVDQQYRYTCFNDAHASVMKTIYGKKIEIGVSLLNYMTVKEDREKAKRNLDRALAGEVFVEAAYSGEEERSRRYFEVSHNPINTNDDTIIGVAVVAKDITERKRIQEQLRESEEEYRSLFDRMLDGVYRSTHEGRFVDVNPAFVRMFGYSSRQEMLDIPNIGKTLYFSPEERGSHIPQTAEKGVEVFPMRRKDGSMIWVEDHGGYVHDKHGRVAFHEGILRDITERKKAEEALRLSEAKYRALVDNATDLIFLIGEKDEILSINPAAARFLGTTIEQILGKSLFDVYPKDIATMFSENVRAVLQKGESKVIDERIAFAGKELWINTRLEPVSDDCGRAYAVTGISRDITKRKRLEHELERYSKHLEDLVEERTKELRASEEKYRSLIQNIPEAIWTSDRASNSIFVSSTIERLNGYTAKEILEEGKNILAARTHPDDLDRVNKAYEALFERNEPFNVEYRFQKKDGTWVWLHDRAASTYVKDGVRYADGIVSDITEHKRMEEDLRASMERLDFLVTANPAVIFSGKPNSDLTDFHRTYFSRNLTSMLGYAPEDFINDPKFGERHIHPEDRKRVMDSLPRLFREGHVSNDFRFLHKDGSYRWIRAKTRAIADATGKPVQVVGYWTDVTEEKRLEEALLKSERLAAIGETTAMVGHDLRNPLQGMTGALYLLRNLSKSQNVQERNEVVELLDALDEQILYMNKIVSDLQHYAGSIGVEPVVINLPELIKDTLSSVNIPGNVETTVVAAQEEPSMVRVDSALLKRILLNLIVNAVQAMPNGGRLAIESSKKSDSLTVSVKDTGEGIAKENLGRIFNPFFTTKAKGQGLGLAVCKRLVEAQDGTIIVTSEVGKGSTFTVMIPINKTRETS